MYYMKGQVKTWHMVDYCELIMDHKLSIMFSTMDNILPWTNSIQFSTMDNINATHYIATTRLGYRSTDTDSDIIEDIHQMLTFFSTQQLRE